jgi:hypothetical protein
MLIFAPARAMTQDPAHVSIAKLEVVSVEFTDIELPEILKFDMTVGASVMIS